MFLFCPASPYKCITLRGSERLLKPYPHCVTYLAWSRIKELERKSEKGWPSVYLPIGKVYRAHVCSLKKELLPLSFLELGLKFSLCIPASKTLERA